MSPFRRSCPADNRPVGSVPCCLFLGAAAVAWAALAPLKVAGQQTSRPSSAPQSEAGPEATPTGPGSASDAGMAMAYLARNTARPTVPAAPPPRVAPPIPLPAVPRVAQRSKPFSNDLGRRSTISPYLALDAPTTDSSLTNYYLFVRPQLEQQARSRVQQAQYQRVQKEVQRGSGLGTSPAYERAGDYTHRFMNSGSYYPGQR